jgi:dTDP-glucose 4,6-dehydratase
MRKKLPKILVTGGAGFIGNEFVRQAVLSGHKVIVIDKLTYAGDLKRLQSVQGRFRFYKTDICNSKAVEKIFKKENPRFLVHFAAESHVDRSI